MNEVDEFLSGLKGEQKGNPFETSEADIFADVNLKETGSENVEDKGEKEEDEKPLPFHKDPKVQKFIEKEISKRMEDFKPSETEKFREEVGDREDEITDVLTRVIGNDTPERIQAVKDMRRIILDREDKGAEKAMQMLEQRESQERQVYAEAEDEVESGFERIGETFGIDLDAPQSSRLRNDFIDFLGKLSPKDSEGNIVEYADFETAFETFQDMNKKTMPSNSKAKELASRGVSRAADASNAHVAKDTSWKGVEKMFGKLLS